MNKTNMIKIDKTISLVGLMGCGKSSIGKRLAERLSVPFFDLDKEIEKRENLSVSEIFKEYGEDYFRNKEIEVASDILDGQICVLATGGGAFINENIRKLILEKSVSIWIKASFEILYERVAKKNTRPLLEVGNKAEILKKLMDERYPIYEEASITVHSTEGPHDKLVDEIIKELKERS